MKKPKHLIPGIGILVFALMGCEGQRDPLTEYEQLKNSVTPHNNHELPVIIKEAQYDPQHLLVNDMVIVETEPFAGFLEGKEDELRVRVRSMALQDLNFKLRTEGFPGDIQPTQDSENPELWTIRWKPEPGFVPSNRRHQKQQFRLVVDILEEQTAPELLAALENHVMQSTVFVDVYRDLQPPEILSIDFEGDKDWIEINEGELAHFSVVVKAPGASELTRPEISPSWRSYLNSEDHQILNGTSFIKQAPGKAVEQIDANTWRYHLVFDTENEQIAYPSQIVSSKRVDTEMAHYRALLSAFQIIDFSGERSELKPSPGPSSFAETIDIRVRYTGKNASIIFPWETRTSPLQACPGERLNLSFDLLSNAGMGQLRVDTQKAIRDFQTQKGISDSSSSLECEAPNGLTGRTSCLFRWLIPQDQVEGSYSLNIDASLVIDQDGPNLQKSSGQKILIGSKNGLCPDFAPEKEITINNADSDRSDEESDNE